ncbi:glycoside hydrolase family 128 protein, partial [Baudoinia panamericana UAMH 10762]
PTAAGGKRGLAYNTASLTAPFMTSSQMGFAYNWVSNPDGFTWNAQSAIKYIPLLHSSDSMWTSTWNADAASAIKSGSEYLFSFNEPDLSTQANMSPQQAVTAWKTYMEPFAGQAKLCAPAVTNGGGAMGLTWLANFLSLCSGCTIDCVNIHWYDSYSNTAYFKSHVDNATTIGGNRPVFVSEFGTTDGTADQISGFLETVMPYMDSNDNVAGYAYFMVSNGLLVSGTSPSSYGSTYATYTG